MNEVDASVMKCAFGMSNVDDSLSKLPRPRPEPQLAWQRAHQAAARHMADQAKRHGIDIVAERRLSCPNGVFRYQVQSSRDISDRYPGTTVWLDGDTGRFLAFEAPTGALLGTKISGSTISTSAP